MDLFFGLIIGASLMKLYVEHKLKQDNTVHVSHPDTQHLDRMKSND